MSKIWQTSQIPPMSQPRDLDSKLRSELSRSPRFDTTLPDPNMRAPLPLQIGEDGYCPVSKVQSAPPPAFCIISFGSIVHRNLVTLSMLEPAAPSAGTPAAAMVAPTSLASRPVSVRLRDPKLSSQLRDVISSVLTRQTTESASTEIFWLGVKPNEVLPRNRRAMTRLLKARTDGECGAITAAKAKAVGPVALPGAANAMFCTTVKANAAIISFFIYAASVGDSSGPAMMNTNSEQEGNPERQSPKINTSGSSPDTLAALS